MFSNRFNKAGWVIEATSHAGQVQMESLCGFFK